MSIPMNNLGGNLPLNNSSNFGSLPSGPESGNKVGDTNMYGQQNANPVDYMQNQDFGNSGLPMDSYQPNSYNMYLNDMHNNEPMTMMGQPGDVSQGQGDLNGRIPSYQLQFNPVAGGPSGGQGASIGSGPLLSGGVASKQPLHHNLTNTDSFVSVQLQGGGMMHQPPLLNPNTGVPMSHGSAPSMHGGDIMLPRMSSNVPGQPLLSDQQNWRPVNGMAPQGGPTMMSLPQMGGGVNGVQTPMNMGGAGTGGGGVQGGGSSGGPQGNYQLQNPMMPMGSQGGMHAQHPGSHPPSQQQQQMAPQMQQHQPAPSQQGNFVGNKLQPREWHRAEHQGSRDNMVVEIIKLLKTRRPNATDDWHEKLPHMAKRLEDALYHDAGSLDEYNENSSLKQRLQQLALSMGGNTKSGNKSGGGGGGSGGQGGGRQPSGQLPPQQQSQGGNPQYAQQGQGQAQLQQQYQYQQMQYQQQMQQQQQHQQQQPQQQQYQMNPNQYGSNGGQPLQQQGYPVQMQQGYPGPGNNQRQGSGGSVGQHQMYGGGGPNQGNPGGFNANNGYGPPQGGMDYSQMGMQQPPQGGGGAGGHQGMGGMMGNPGMMYNQGMMMPDQQNGGHMSTDMMGSGGYGMNGQQNGPGPQQHQNRGGGGGGNANNMYGASGGNLMQGGPPMGGGQYGVPGGMDDGGYGNNMMMVNRGGAPMNPQNPHMGGQMAPNHGMMPMQNSMAMQPSNGGGVMQGMPGVPGGNGHTDEHRKQVLKQQQQRLLLLRHASKCPHDNGRCPVTPHCWSMKVLWKHIMSCKDQECKVPHCVSSRYVLSHYSKCKEQSCPVCGPVREAIKRNYERSRDVVKMARNPPVAGGYANQYGSNMQQAPRDEPPAKKQKMDKKGKNDTTTLTITQPPSLKLNIRQKNVYPLDPISCAIYSFTSEQISSHFKNIQEGMKLTVAKIKEMCKPIMDELLKIPHAYGVFGTPVDPVALNLPDYFDVVKIPMDLGTVVKRLDSGSYRDTHNFVVDVHLTFDNAMNYNPKNSDVYVLAKSLKKDFDNKYRQKITEFESALEAARCSADSCLICGEVSLKFEPPVYYCNGTCAQRIRRNATFYSNSTNTYHWCSSCFNALRDNETIRLPDCVITRAELLRGKKKHTEESEEGWVQCEGGCTRWVHQVCSLFNARRNVSDEVSYVCPVCIQERRRKYPDQIIVAPTTKKMRAADLPVSVLSEFLEKRIYDRLEIAYHENAEKLNVSVNEVEKCPPLCLRQVACLDKMHTVREGVFNRYKDKNYPTDFPCRTKCLVLFQNIDGQDVILFGMYVYEYGHKCPQPNQRRVYISYLDSVHYLRPKQYRTLVYHEILVSYLDYVRARGFHTAHIWACPPQKGDDYILYVHPSDQKTPKPQILRVWYDEMLKIAKERGIVHEITDLHTEYLVDHTNDATVLPYFEGDYWVNEAEVIIKDLGEGRKSNTSAAANNDEDDEEDGAGAVGAQKSKRKQKTKRPTRTTSKPALAQGRDPVMAKLASIIEPMKDTFFVARLHPKEYAEKFAELRKAEITAEASENTTESNNAREKQLQEEALSGTEVQMPVIPVEEKKEAPASSSSSSEQQQQGGEGDDASQDEEEDDFARLAGNVGGENGGDSNGGGAEGTSAMDVAMERDNEEDKEFGDSIAQMRSLSAAPSQNNLTVDTAAAAEANVGSAYSASSTPTTRSSRTRKNGTEDSANAVEVKEEAASDNAASGEGNNTDESAAAAIASSDATSTEPASSSDVAIKTETVVVKTEGSEVVVETDTQVVKMEEGDSEALLARLRKSIMVGENLPKLTDDTEDVDDVQENEHFDTRQSFLNLCQGNHYQFDQLRRAKHTSMMVLYHLHNPDAPKFVPSCSACHADILTGYRYHCESCEIDYCHSCYQANGSRIHHHQLRPVNTSSSAPTQLTEEQRRERARSVQLHMQLLTHAANCVKCESKNCLRMKEFLKHDSTCQTKVNGGCRLCARISNLLNIHARACRVDNCPVPHCLELREQIRKLTLRQQQMDDRRRKKFNSEYNRGTAPAVVPADEE